MNSSFTVVGIITTNLVHFFCLNTKETNQRKSQGLRKIAVVSVHSAKTNVTDGACPVATRGFAPRTPFVFNACLISTPRRRFSECPIFFLRK